MDQQRSSRRREQRETLCAVAVPRRTAEDLALSREFERPMEEVAPIATPGRRVLRTAGRNLTQEAEQKQRSIEPRLRYNLGRWNQELTGELDPNV
jgi:hypothetical protein